MSVPGGIDWGTVALTLNEVHWIWVYLLEAQNRPRDRP